MNPIIWIVVSGIAGYIASKIINKSGSGLLMDIGLGIVGGFVGGFIVKFVPGFNAFSGKGGMGGLIVELIVATLGAMAVIYFYNMAFRKGPTS